MYSVWDAVNGRPGWVRVGSDVCYYRNSYQNPGGRGRCYLTTTFSVKFPHENDVCYFAYHFPYTYTQLMVSSPNIINIISLLGVTNILF